VCVLAYRKDPCCYSQVWIYGSDFKPDVIAEEWLETAFRATFRLFHSLREALAFYNNIDWGKEKAPSLPILETNDYCPKWVDHARKRAIREARKLETVVDFLDGEDFLA